MRFAWHVACMGRKRSSYKVLVGKRKVKKPSEGLGAGGTVILICLQEKCCEVVGTQFTCFRIRNSGELL
jgi:hypothetical protein